MVRSYHLFLLKETEKLWRTDNKKKSPPLKEGLKLFTDKLLINGWSPEGYKLIFGFISNFSLYQARYGVSE